MSVDSFACWVKYSANNILKYLCHFSLKTGFESANLHEMPNPLGGNLNEVSAKPYFLRKI